MEYRKIFKPDVLDILIKKVKTPVRNLNVEDLHVQALKVLPLIKKIEEDYKKPLEDLAIQIVKDAYPVIKDMNIRFNVSITDSPNLLEQEDNEPTSGELKKRRILNAITQGAAVRGTSLYHMITDELNLIDERLIPAYNKILQSVFGIYDLLQNSLSYGNEFDINEQVMGLVKVSYEKDTAGRTVIVINAQAVCFPFLIHEIVKGIYQTLSSQGWKDLNLARKTNIQNAIDTPENEHDDLRFGKYIYDAINEIISKYTSDSNYDSRVRDFFLVDLYKIDNPTSFVSYIQNAIRNDLNDDQIAWTKETIRDIIDDLKADDADDVLSEMK